MLSLVQRTQYTESKDSIADALRSSVQLRDSVRDRDTDKNLHHTHNVHDESTVCGPMAIWLGAVYSVSSQQATKAVSQDPRPNTLPDFEIRSLLSIKPRPSMKNQPSLTKHTHPAERERERERERQDEREIGGEMQKEIGEEKRG